LQELIRLTDGGSCACIAGARTGPDPTRPQLACVREPDAQNSTLPLFFFEESRDFISINHHSVIQEGSPATYVGRLQEYNQLFYAALHSTLPLVRRPVVRGLFFHGCENRAQPASNFGESGVVPADGHVLLLICHGPMDYIDLRRVTLVLRRLR
jgi:hypothetical protein